MAFAQLLQNPVLLSESTALTILRVVKYEARLIENGDFVRILKLTALVPANDRFIDKSTITGQVFDKARVLAVFILTEENTMAI